MTVCRTSRRTFLQSTGAAAAAVALGSATPRSSAAAPDAAVEVLSPRGRVPVSFIIDDSTCLVNMGHFCMPQFTATYPQRKDYQKPWRSWPREIPDEFVRRFGEWCADHGVRGKYSVVPYPACVGWLDRELPGWSRRELQSSVTLVRDLMVPNWDIHPEMISHTHVIDLATGRPLGQFTPATMENSYPQEQKSVDELAAYLAYALSILKNCDLPCDGITTPGGFGSRVKSELSLAVQQAVGDVFGSEIPHYFKYIASEGETTDPRLEHLDRDGDALRVTVNLPAGTGDWFGGWEGDTQPQPDRYITRDGRSGRLVELIESGQPATFLCHWPGIYCNGSEAGFAAFRQVVTAVNEHYGDRTIWMKLSEMARYWTAKELGSLRRDQQEVTIESPVACPAFTVRVPGMSGEPEFVGTANQRTQLRQVQRQADLMAGTWVRRDDGIVACFDVPKGRCSLHWAG